MKGHRWIAVLVMTLAAPAVAAAQDWPEDADGEVPPAPDDDDDDDEDMMPPEPEPDPEPEPKRVVVAENGGGGGETTMVSAGASAGGRPEGFAIGLGLGYDLPADLQAPDTTSVRIRLASGLTFEPRVVLGRSGSSFEPPGGPSSDSSTFEMSLATDVRYPWRLRGPVDLVLVGGASFGILSNNPDGDDNNSSTTTVALNWGLGVEYWRSPHWVLSLTGMNPLVSFASTSQEQGPDMEQTSSSNLFGIIFDPNIIVMLHLFL